MSNKIAGVVTKMVGALEALENADERGRAVQAALAVFGDKLPQTTNVHAASRAPAGGHGGGEEHESQDGIHAAGRAWMKRHGVTAQQLEQVYHVDGDSVSILGAHGKGKRQQTINTYLLTGVAALLQSGKAEFSDDTARGNCSTLGCYDVANHNKTLGEFKNRITGSKNKGWKLTTPGLSAAATVVKNAAGDQEAA